MIGVIGIGNMGGAMALRLLDGGHAVAVRDIEPAREHELRQAGAVVMVSPAEVAAACDLVVVVVVTAQQTRDVLFGPDGVAGRLQRGGCVMLCPTVGPDDVEGCAAKLAEAGIDCIEAPMSGGPLRARDGSMSLMVACSDALFERHRALLEWLASRLVRVGTRLGDGARTKLVNNLIAAVNLAGAAEGLALAEAVGLDPSRMLDVLERSSGYSWVAIDRFRRWLAGDRVPQAHASLLRKDSHLALDMAGKVGFETPVGAQAAALFARACDEAGLAGEDDAVLFEMLRRR